MDDQQPLQSDAATTPRWTIRSRIVAAVIALVLIAAGVTGWRMLTQPTPIHIAFANTLSGPLAPTGNEILTAARLYCRPGSTPRGRHRRSSGRPRSG